MPGHNCENCSFRAKHDDKPESILGRIWRWHINWCPGWSRYMKSLSDDKSLEISVKYNLKK